MAIEKLTSRENPRLIRARKIRDGREPDSIFIEGKRLVDEALRSDLVIEECFVVEGFNDEELLGAAAARTRKVADVPERLFASISDTKQPQGIALIAERPSTSSLILESSLASTDLRIVVFLFEINNPSNLGAIMRTAAAAGVAGIIVSTNSADVYSPKSLRASMGAAFTLPVWDEVTAEQAFDWAAGNMLTCTATAAAADLSYTEVDWTKPRLLIFGSEAGGLEGLDLPGGHDEVRIPMTAGIESLNLAVSAGIILFEARRQMMT